MPWLLLEILIVVLALVGLGLVVLSLWRKVKALGAEVGLAGEAIGKATDELAELQPQSPPSA